MKIDLPTVSVQSAPLSPASQWQIPSIPQVPWSLHVVVASQKAKIKIECRMVEIALVMIDLDH